MDGMPNALNAALFAKFFLFGLMTACIVQPVSFLVDVFCSNDSKVQKERGLWKKGVTI